MFKGITVALLALRNTPLFKPEALNLIKLLIIYPNPVLYVPCQD